MEASPDHNFEMSKTNDIEMQSIEQSDASLTNDNDNNSASLVKVQFMNGRTK